MALLFKRRIPKMDSRITNLLNDINSRKTDSINKGEYSFFANRYAQDLINAACKANNYEALEQYYEIIKTWDDICNLPLECGTYLENLCNQEDRMIAIHRTYLGEYNYEYGVPINDRLLGILQLGLQNMGHVNAGADSGLPHPNLTTSPLASFSGFVNLIGSYKNNNTTIIVNFPASYVDEDGALRKPEYANYIYDFINGAPYIKPEYIEFVIIKNKDGLDYYYSADEIMETLRRNVQ